MPFEVALISHGVARLGVATIVSLLMMTSAWAFSAEPATAATATSTAPATSPSESPTLLRFEEHNFALEAPPIPWVLQPAQLLPSGGVVAYARPWPSTGFMILAEPVGPAAALTLDEMEKVVLSNVRRAARDVQVLDRRPEELNGMAGLRIDLQAREAGTLRAYRFWICSRQGYMYQLVANAPLADAARMHAAIEPLVRSFRQIDPERMARAPGEEPIGRFVSPRFGYAVEPKDPRWVKWPDVNEQLGGTAEFGGKFGETSCFIIVPVAFLGDTPEVEAVAPVLLARMNVDWEKVTDLRRVTEGKAAGYACRYSRVVDGARYRYAFKILAGDGYAWMASAWTDDAAPGVNVDEVLASITRPSDEPVRCEAQALTPQERQAHAVLMRELGLHYYYKNAFDRAVKYFQIATPLDPENPVNPANEAQCYLAQRAYGRARDVAREHLKRLPDAPVLLCKYAMALGETGGVDEALLTYARAFAGDYVNEFQFENYVALLRRADKLDQALDAVVQYRRHVPDVNMLLLHSQVLSELDRHDEAVELLKRRQTEVGMNAEVSSALAERLNAAERFTEALEVATALRTAGYDSAYTQFLIGRAQCGMKWYREAKASLEEALSREPDFPRAKELLQHVSGMLGEGDSAAVRNPIDPVTVPPVLLAGADAASTTRPAELEEESAIYRLRLRAVRFERGKQLRRTEHLRVQILNRRGVEDFSTMQFEFDPIAEQMYVNKVEVRDATGKVLSTGDPSRYYLVDDRSAGGTASSDRTLNVPVPGLKPGCTLETQVTWRDRATSTSLRFDDWYFSSGLPVERSTYYLSGDLDSMRWSGPLVPLPQKADGAMSWTVEWPQVYRNEPLRPSLSKYLPRVAVCDATLSWEGEAKDYLSTIRELLAPDESVRTLARELTEGVETPRERLAAILRHVQREYTYKAIEFGRRGRVPQSGAETLRNRYGDCKDHALLLRQLLGCAGIEARLALVSTHGQLNEELPSLDQFNHMIVYAPKLQKFFDATTKDLDLSPGVPWGLARRKTLVLEEAGEGGGTIVAVGDHGADAADLSSRREARIVGEGDLEVRDTVSAGGLSAAYLRSVFRGAGGSAADRQRTLQDLLSPYADVTVRDVRLQNVEEPDRPFIIESIYVLRRCFRREGASGQGWVGQVPAVWERFYFRADHIPVRRTPFELRTAMTVRGTVSLSMPPETTVAATPAEASADSPFATTRIQHRADGARVTAEVVTRRIPGEHPASAYEKYEAAMDQLVITLEPRLRLEGRQGPAATP